MVDRVGKKLGPSSWVKQCEAQEVRKLTDNLLNPRKVRFWSPFLAEDLAQQDDDIDYRVRQNDRIDRLAEYFYGERLLWWVIAQRNKIDQPSIELYEGRMLVIPSPAFVARTLQSKFR